MSIDIYNDIQNPFKAFEGAATNYQVGLRGIFDGQADELAVRELQYLQNRSAHLCRNNGYAKSALKNWVTNANHIKVIWKFKNGKAHKLMQGYWDEFAASPSFDGHGDIKTLQGVSNSSIFLTGNSHIRKLIVREGNKNTVPLKLQLIPTSLHAVLHTDMTEAYNIDRITKYGITFEDSVPVQYHYNRSNLDNLSVRQIAVPASEIVHTFIRDEPGQWLGIPILAPVLLSLYALDDLVTATISKQKAAQTIAVIVEQTGTALNLLPVGGVKTKDTDDTDKIHYKNDAKESQVLYPQKGETVKMFQGTDIGTNFGVLVEAELRKIATTADALYHQLTGDTSGLNYSSLIGMALQSRNRLEWLHNFIFIPLREKPIADSFKELAVLYNPKVATAIPYFQLPRWRGYDDLKDAQADILELQNGLGTLPDKLAERGLTVEDILADMEERKVFKDFGIEWNTQGANPSLAQTNNTAANSNSTST